jgi:hypothetical protein
LMMMEANKLLPKTKSICVFNFFSKRFRIRFKSLQKPGKSVMRWSVRDLGLNAFGFSRRDIARRGDNGVNVILVSYFWRIHFLFLTNNCSTA